MNANSLSDLPSGGASGAGVVRAAPEQVASRSVAGDLVALVELGSNAVRLLVARLGPGVGFEVLEEKRVQTRLGSGRPGILRADSIERTVMAVHQFLTRARRDRDPRVIAVATAAVRDASNRERLLGPLRRRDRIEIRVLSGREEALLGALAVQSSMRLDSGLVADHGGGSLPVTRLRGGMVAASS